jgi:hypothetical protein
MVQLHYRALMIFSASVSELELSTSLVRKGRGSIAEILPVLTRKSI